MTTPSPALTSAGQKPPRQAENALATQKSRSRVATRWSRSAYERIEATPTAQIASTYGRTSWRDGDAGWSSTVRGGEADTRDARCSSTTTTGGSIQGGGDITP